MRSARHSDVAALRGLILTSLSACIVLWTLIGLEEKADAQTAVPISRNTTYQWIDGFGAAQPGGQHYCETNPATLCTCPNHPTPPNGDGNPELGTCSNTTQCGGALGSGGVAGACIIGTQDFASSLYFMSDPYRGQVLDQLFSTLGGIGLSILRMKVNPAIAWSSGTMSPQNDIAQGWIMSQTAARGPVKLMASVWSPPGWLKSNGATLGGFCSGNGSACRLDFDYQAGVYGARCPTDQVCLSANIPNYLMQSFATYLADFATQYALYYGINIYALSFTNEPDNHAVHWDTCGWTGNSIRDFLATPLTNTFNSRGVSTRVIAPESSHWSFVDRDPPVATEVSPALALDTGPYLTPTYASTAARNRVDIAAAHLYPAPDTSQGLGDPVSQSAMQFSSMLNPTTHVWQTEDPGYGCNSTNTCNNTPGTCLCGVGETPMGKLMKEMLIIHNGLTSAWISGWLWFQAYNGGQSAGLIGNNSTGNTLVNPVLFRTKMYWALGNFSRFIRPGFVRIGANSQPLTGVYVSAYKDPNMDSAGPLVIVVINSTSSSKSLQFQNVAAYATPYVTSSTLNLAAQSDVYLGSAVSVPALSVVTYVANPPKKSSDLLFQDSTGKTMIWLGAIAATANYPHTTYPSPWTWSTDWTIKGVGDFDNDGQADILWRDSTGALAIWHNGQASNVTYPGTIPNDWAYSGLVDFNNNGKVDILWRYVDGTTAYWQDGNSAAVGWPGALPNSWQIQGVGDFDGNGLGDILWRQTDGTTAIWHDGSASWTTWPGAVDNGWQIQGVGEFDGNGKSDIVWRHVSGSTAIWHDGTASGTYPGALATDWQLQGVGDYDGNGKSDLLWRNTNGTLAIWQDANAGWTTYPGNPGGTWAVRNSGRFDK